MARALVVQHVEVDAPALVAVVLEAAGVELVVHRADQAGAPPAIDGFDALVVMGGPRSAHSDDGFPTRRAELALIADALDRELPVLGLCLGAQLLAEASGGRARRGAAGLEVGWAEVALTPAATDDELFATAPATFTPLHWHGDTVVLPPGAVLLASSDRYPNQAFRAGHRAWGIQFHLEADRALVEAFAAEWPTEARHLEGGAAGIVAEADLRLAALAPVTASVLGRFASTASGEGGRWATMSPMSDPSLIPPDIDPDQYRVHPGTSVHLDDWSTNTTDGFDGSKAQAQAALIGMNERLADLQQLLYAEAGHKMLVVLQGMDTSGKDGTIKHVFRTINPVGVKVANFKRPNDVELAHDYLWRIHEHTPRNGRMVIFNRSHYEDVLVVRVHDLVPEKVWSRRFEHIRGFEKMLTDEGTVLVKLFLHISKKEQKARLQERLDNPAKHWKFEHGDVSERAHWDAYTEAYEEAIAETTTHAAPWYVVPADRKWYRNLVVSQLLIEKLEGLDMSYPEPIAGIESIRLTD